MSNTMDQKSVWDRYVAAWKAESAQEKLALFETCLTRECTYTDPLRVAQGWEALVAYMLEFHQQIPGGHFVTEYFSSHHQRSIAKWQMLSADTARMGEGTSYGEYDANGLLVAMTGFFETTAS